MPARSRWRGNGSTTPARTRSRGAASAGPFRTCGHSRRPLSRRMSSSALWGTRAASHEAVERARQPIWRLDLFEKLHRPASWLSLSDRRRLELARALAMRPNLLLLDEILAGLRPT